MARSRPRLEVETARFFELLNNRDDLTAVVHGLSVLEAALDEALEAMLKKAGLTGYLLSRHGSWTRSTP